MFDNFLPYSGNFDAFQPVCQNLTRQIFNATQHLMKDSDIHQSVFHQIFGKSISVIISPCQNFLLYGTVVWEI